MTTQLSIARTRLLEPVGLDDTDIENTLGQLAGRSIDLGDLYFESTRAESWVLEDSIIREGAHSIDQGVGIRAVSGDKTGFAYADELARPALRNAARAARAIARSGGGPRLQSWRRRMPAPLYTAQDPLSSLPAADKTALLKRVDALARARDPRVTQVIAGLSAVHTTVLVAATDGTLTADVRPLVRLNVTVIVEHDKKREQGTAGGGGRFGYDYFLGAGVIEDYVEDAVEQALANLDAAAAPAGAMTVVLGPGWPGILLHEAIGHGLEGDFNRKQTSAFCNRIGERVASEEVTVVDDGTIPDRRGSLTIDDEGTPAQNTTLIERGILRTYMQDKLNARLMGLEPTGNGRRESYAHLPLPRMTNTYMLAGKHDPEEIIASVQRGIYATQFGGGQVDITNGKFVFSATQAWRIENGKLCQPIKGATLIGNGPDVLTRVSMVGNDLQLDAGIGVCGKDGQSVPVGVGQPSIRIDELTVGGTAV